MLKNIPVQLSGYKLRATEEAAVKTYTNDQGMQEVAIDQQSGATMYVLSVLMKQLPTEDRPAGKGFEVRVTLETDPSGQVEEGQLVELISPRINEWEIKGRKGVSLKAKGVKPVEAS